MPNLTEHIVEDLSRRLGGARGARIDLTLAALAEEYSCSTRPIRAALEKLEADKLIVRDSSRRYRATRLASSKARSAKARVPQPNDGFESIRKIIIELGFKGETAFLREEESAERFGVSRAQIRDAFMKLSAQGIIEHVPRRGWKIRTFQQQDLKDFLVVRDLLERKALELAWDRLERERIESILSRNQIQGGRNNRPVIDNSLHAYWIDVSNNRYIKTFFSQNAPYFELLFEWEDHNVEASKEAVSQHREILSNILEGRRQAALKALSKHIFDNHPVLESMR